MLSSLFLICLTAWPVDSAGNWPQWRGPKRDGVSPDTGLLTQWPKEGPKLLWEAKGAGRGYASLAIANGRIFTLGDGLSTASDKDEYATCFDEATGKQLWKTKLGPAWTAGQQSWQSSRSTPTIDGEGVYYITPQGNLVCLRVANGSIAWQKSLTKDFQGGKGDIWGYSESPLIDGDMVVVTPGKAANTMVALNKKTGKLIWSAKVKDDSGAGHSSIMVSEVGGQRVYVQTTAANVLGVRAKDGKVLWTYRIGSTAVIPTPIIKDDLVLAIAGYDKGGAALLRQVPDGDNVTVKEIYPYNKDMRNKHGGVVLLGDYVYGDSDDRGLIYCHKLETGEAQKGWKVRGSGTGSAAVSAADGHLYVRYQNGVIALVKADPTAYKETGSFKIPHSESRPSWSHPVITGGKLFLREGDYILCYDVTAK